MESIDISVRIAGETFSESMATTRAGKLPTVMGLQTQLVQLFQNLIGNAIKYRSPDR
jgi:light-regulated signal transduction histidine kinase (bacteriophytochrome)